MAILLTGATGFIGRHVVRKLRSEPGRTVVAPARLRSNPIACVSLRDAGVVLEDGLFYKRDFVEDLIKRHAVSHVVHLAAVRGAGKSAGEYRSLNVEATHMLLEASLRAGVRCFVYGSSVGVWGTIPKQVPPDRLTECVPDTLYHASKIEAEKAVRRFREKGLNAIIVRPTITYGLGDTGFPATLVKLVRKKRFVLPLPDVMIHLVSVQAVADCIARILHTGDTEDDLYVVLDREPVSLHQLVDCIHRYFHDKPYPSIMAMPRAVFAAADWACGLLRSDVGRVRMKLLGRDWHYRSLGSYEKLCYEPPQTMEAFGRYLQDQWPAGG